MHHAEYNHAASGVVKQDLNRDNDVKLLVMIVKKELDFTHEEVTTRKTPFQSVIKAKTCSA